MSCDCGAFGCRARWVESLPRTSNQSHAPKMKRIYTMDGSMSSLNLTSNLRARGLCFPRILLCFTRILDTFLPWSLRGVHVFPAHGTYLFPFLLFPCQDMLFADGDRTGYFAHHPQNGYGGGPGYPILSMLGFLPFLPSPLSCRLCVGRQMHVLGYGRRLHWIGAWWRCPSHHSVGVGAFMGLVARDGCAMDALRRESR